MAGDRAYAFAAPVRRALTEPVLLAGAPRAIALVNGTIAASLGVGLRLWLLGLLVWVAGHALAVWAAKRDPLIFEVGRRALRIPARLEV
jgi:type IV secretion system protein VirB3